MPAKCSHHDLMRWFSCNSMPSVVLCNSETSTPWFPWPVCVTSAFVRIRHVAHSRVKHAERLQKETGVHQAVNQCGVCGLKMRRKGRERNGYQKKRKETAVCFVRQVLNFPYERTISAKSTVCTVEHSHIQK